jgi:hypothetical protein
MYDKLIGKPVGILTTTMYYTGTLQRVEHNSLVLINADWVGETGVWSDFAENLGASEQAPFPAATEVYVNLAQVVIVFGADEKLVKSSKLTKRLTPKS